MEFINCVWLPPGKSERPTEPAKGHLREQVSGPHLRLMPPEYDGV